MRQDVKLGVLVAAAIVLLAGGYYLFRGQEETPIPVTTGGPLASQTPKEKPTKPATTPPRTTNQPTSPRTAQGGSTTPGGTQPDASRRTTPVKPTPRPQPGSTPSHSTGVATNMPSRTTSTTTPDAARRTMPATVGESSAEPQPNPATRRAATSRTTRPSGTANVEPQRPTETPTPAANESAAPNRVASAAPSSTQPASPAESDTPAEPSALRNEVIGEAAATESHRVQPGDTYQSLSMMYYGDARFAVFLMRSNPQISGGRLQPGQVVKIPPRPGQPAPTSTVPPSVATRRTPPASTATSRPTPLRGESATAGNAARSYTVREGDSFYAIARDVLGNAARWQELFELNRDAVKGDPKRLRIGQVIQLPES